MSESSKTALAALQSIVAMIVQKRFAGERPVAVVVLVGNGNAVVRCAAITQAMPDHLGELLAETTRGSFHEAAPLRPDHIVEDLKNAGVGDPENALYILVLASTAEPSPDTEKPRRTLLNYGGQWRPLLKRHGLIVIDASAEQASEAVSQRHKFLLEMAMEGFFVEPDLFQKKTADATLNLFKSRDYRIRQARMTDMPALMRLEDECWAKGIQAEQSIIENRLVQFPDGQLILEGDGGGVVGVVYSQRVAAIDFTGQTASAVQALHRADGPIVQLLALNVLPAMQQLNLGDELLEVMLQYCALMPGIDQVVGITRCKDYPKHKDLPVAEYIAYRNEHGRLVDPVLRFHELHGATVKGLVAGYRPKDADNNGYGVLVHYDIHHRTRNEIHVDSTRAAPIADSHIEPDVAEAVAAILRSTPDDIPSERPLFELGLDSADLLDLRERLKWRFGIDFEPVFFFEHNTCARIASQIRARLVPDNDGALPSTGQAHVDVREQAPFIAYPRETDRPRSNVSRATDVAVIGVACQLPGDIATPDAFWSLLASGRDAIGRLPADRWSWPSNIDPETDHRGIDFGGFLSDVANFDAAFFRISPNEAAMMDPQQRLLLQLSWACLEDAAYAPKSLAGTETGVFVGASGSDYQLRLCESGIIDVDGHFGLATSMAILANRISYFYDWHGPSLQIDTACSSSLVALHDAVKAMNAGSCRQALVAGINIICHPANSIAFYKAGMLSRDGKCKTFDDDADGYVRSEGAVALLLKPLADAVEAGDKIYCVIKGVATNHGGQAAGLTVPSHTKQADLILKACRDADIAAQDLNYMEVHGTGTSLGDPIEIQGLKGAFARAPNANGTPRASCGIGSVKTNIGHLEAAAGIAGFLKVALCLQHKKLPASLNYKKLNRHISLADSPFFIIDQMVDWPEPSDHRPRRAGISSFGSGGSNAHVIVEEHETNSAAAITHGEGARPRPVLIVLSAKSEERLRERARQLLQVLQTGNFGENDLTSIGYTLQIGREAMDDRLGLLVGSMDDLQSKLRSYLAGETQIEGCHRGFVKRDKDAITSLFEDTELQEAVERWIAKGKYGKLLDLWVKGLPIDWRQLYGDVRPRCVGLPTYPFAKERHWLLDQIQERSQVQKASENLRRRKPESRSAQTEDTAEHIVTSCLADVLGLNSVDIAADADLRDLGFDSIVALKLQRNLEAACGIAIPARDLLTLSTAQALASYLAPKLESRKPTSPERDRSCADIPEAARPAAFDVSFSDLSVGQRGLWSLQQLSPGMSAYNVPLCLQVKGVMDADAFDAAFRHVIAQHPLLSAAVVMAEGGPRWEARPAGDVFKSADISGIADDAVIADLTRRAKVPFVLSDGGLVRAELLRRSMDESFILFVIHHIVFDAGSLVPFLSEVLEAYRVLREGRCLPAASSSGVDAYADYVAWERRFLASAEAADHLSFWKRHLDGAPQVLDLPLDAPRPPVARFDGATRTAAVSGELAQRMSAYCREAGITPATLFLGLFNGLLARYAGVEDLVVGLSASVRPLAAFERLIGYCINMIPVRSQLDASTSWAAFLQDLQIHVADCLDHAAYPFAALVRELNVPRLPDRAPVFQVAFTYQNHIGSGALKALSDAYHDVLPFSLMSELHQEGEYELELEVYERAHGFDLNLKYDRTLYQAASIDRMAGHLLTLAERVMADPSASLKDHALISEAERETLLRTWNATAVPLPEACVHQLFARQAQRTPDAIAVSFGEQSLSYGEVDAQSDRLAATLRRRSVGPDVLVGVYLDRSLHLPVTLLGILKAGGAYVPLDPDHPAERIAYVIGDSQLRCIITQTAYAGALQAFGRAALICIDGDWESGEPQAASEEANAIGEEKKDQEQKDAGPDHLAYVTYTSGSTGRPKGVMIPHRALTNVLLALTQNFGLSEGERLLAVTTYGFDIAGFELLGPLLVGAECCICDSETVRNAGKLKDEIGRRKPQLIQATPAIWTMLFNAGWTNAEGVRIVCGGEALPAALRAKLTDCAAAAWNVYGPTETTIWSSLQRLSKDGPSGIGRPLANTRIYILDEALAPTPIGVAGEIHIAGEGLARGYLNQKEMTAERFIVHPFEEGQRLYRTGDMGCWRPDGTIDYLGRRDGQIKLRGYRIELGEIEAQLATHPGIASCAVVLQEINGHPQLVAHYVPKAGQPASKTGAAPKTGAVAAVAESDLRAHLKATLPSYMIPAAFQPLADLPLTPNGKIDRKRLAQQSTRQSQTSAQPASHDAAPSAGAAQDTARHASDRAQSGARRRSRSAANVDAGSADATRRAALERQIADIWTTALGKTDIAQTDGFFEIGGDSIIAVSVADTIRSRLACDFDVTALFANPTIQSAAQYIHQQQSIEEKPAVPRHAAAQSKNNVGRRSREEAQPLDIAIIGLSGRFPQAKDIDEFWANLCAGKDCISEVPKDRWNHDLYFDANRDRPGKTYCKWGGFIDGIDEFDPLFFKISPRQAGIMDPQARLFLMTVWNLLESAGHTQALRQQLYDNQIGVYVGAMHHERSIAVADYDMHGTAGITAPSAIPNLVSSFFDLEGPSLAIDTMCSSSGVAIHMACQDLMRGTCRLAIAGGVNLTAYPNKYIALGQTQYIGSSASSRPFANGDGYLPAETVGAFLLKRLADAITDGDAIHAVIKATATNHNGRLNGYFVPNPRKQSQLFEDCIAASGIDPSTISYVEPAATGSGIADAIEFNTLKAFFERNTDQHGSRAIGSVKTNIGHAEAASTVSQLTKIVLQLRSRTLAPSIAPDQFHPDIAFVTGPFSFQTSQQTWQRPRTAAGGEEMEPPLRAMLNSFGAGGTNVCMIVEEYAGNALPDIGDDEEHGSHIIVFSAKSEERLRALLQQSLEFLDNNPNISLRRLAYTLQTAREEMEVRVAFVTDDLASLRRGLGAYLQNSDLRPGESGRAQAFSGNIEDVSSIRSILVDDTIAPILIATLVEKGRWAEIATLWTHGAKIPWHLFYQGGPLRLVDLPTYPFAKERFPVSVGAPSHAPQARSGGPILHIAAPPFSASTETIEKRVTHWASLVLELPEDKIKPNTDLRNYGLDSLAGTKLRRGLEETFHVVVSGKDILIHSTVRNLAACIEKKIKAAAFPAYRKSANGSGSSEMDDDIVLKALTGFREGSLTEDEVVQLIEKELFV